MTPPLMNRINVVCLGVRDIVKSRAFFLALGFTTPNMEEKPDIVFFQNGGSKLELFPLDQLAADIDANNPPPVAGGFPGFTIAHNADSKEAVDAIFAMVESIGGTIVKKPETVFWGGYSGYFRDPDGYYWEVAYWDGWRFDENGMLIIDDKVVVD